MSRVRVKICGVMSLAEAKAAVDAGADALGFNFWPDSPRFIEPALARSIIASLPPFVSKVGVFARLRVSDRFRGITLIKAVRVEKEADLERIGLYRVSAVLLDSKIKGRFGGTGEHFDWRLAIKAKGLAPIILAGGLRAENAREAITSVRPFALDVCSGVESSPGVKDLEKIRAFMAEVDGANAGR
jgi:phosphoribosylanthranilate isomerase